MLKIGRGTTQTGVPTISALSVTLLLIATTGCVRSSASSSQLEPVTLKIGFGLAAGTNANGIKAVARSIGLEPLVRHARDGRSLPGLVEHWFESPDGLTWRIRLRPSARFHDGKVADADLVRQIVETKLPAALGPAFEDIAAIRTVSASELEVVLKKRSTFLIEQLGELAIEEPGSPLSGTGPFYVSSQQGNDIEMRANASYYGGKPAIDRIVIKPYPSIRSAWADMLRGQVDLLPDVGDALDLLESSNDVKVFNFHRPYAHMVLLNVQKPYLRDPAFRRELNAAIDRDALIADALRGHATPAVSAVWPHHWAYAANDLPRFRYDPHRATSGKARIHLTCIFNEPADERLAIALRRQLLAIGVDLEPKFVSGDPRVRLATGDFDAFLADFLQGPTLVWPYLYWHSGGPFNYGHFRNELVDSALDGIRHAADDSAYKAGVAAFEGAMVNDPPAIFLAWRDRARAVSSRFHVVAEPGADVLFTLREWRPAGDTRVASRN
jgi:peptide/nickel transport system substrate-binding protein